QHQELAVGDGEGYPVDCRRAGGVVDAGGLLVLDGGHGVPRAPSGGRGDAHRLGVMSRSMTSCVSFCRSSITVATSSPAIAIRSRPAPMRWPPPETNTRA